MAVVYFYSDTLTGIHTPLCRTSLLAITASALAPRRAVTSTESLLRIRRSASLLGLVNNLPFGCAGW